jgi:GNAT superfamily N-acetyltransferase
VALIRHATEADLDQIVAMGLEFLATVYGQKLPAPPDPARLKATATWLLEDATTRALLVVERHGQLAGMFGIHVHEHPMLAQRIASELFWWVNADRRGKFDGMRLLAAAREWAMAAGASALHMVAPDYGIERLYERLGYHKVESAYIAAL